jgi:molybdopterin synthase catalytic subunit
VILVSTEDIDIAEVTQSVRDYRAGAVTLFLGTVREFTGDVQTESLEYEAYPEMAVSSMQELADAAKARWNLVSISIVHRIGHLQLGDVAVAVAVSAPHRAEAFEAGRWLIDTLKEQVPIWKKEHYADGETEWIHPDAGRPSEAAADEESA